MMHKPDDKEKGCDKPSSGKDTTIAAKIHSCFNYLHNWPGKVLDGGGAPTDLYLSSKLLIDMEEGVLMC